MDSLGLAGFSCVIPCSAALLGKQSSTSGHIFWGPGEETLW